MVLGCAVDVVSQTADGVGTASGAHDCAHDGNGVADPPFKVLQRRRTSNLNCPAVANINISIVKTVSADGGPGKSLMAFSVRIPAHLSRHNALCMESFDRKPCIALRSPMLPAEIARASFEQVCAVTILFVQFCALIDVVPLQMTTSQMHKRVVQRGLRMKARAASAPAIHRNACTSKMTP